MIDDYDVIYLVSPSSVPWAETTYNDIATTMLFSKMITDVKSVTVTVNDAPYTGITKETFRDFWQDTVLPAVRQDREA